jgi:NAD(P)-dependent dehydrogenase (short-subunit alcohol dehydrogenase family)
VITGGTAGVGRATVREFAARGVDVAIMARGEDGLLAAAGEASQAGVRAIPIEVDVADAGALQDAAERAERELGPIDAWVNCAFASVFATFDDITAEEFQRITDVTYLGFVNGTRSALSLMRTRDRGAIVQVGSALAYRGIPLQTAYCGAKHAIQGFTESLRCELLHEHSGIRVTMVQLPGLNTPQFSWVLARMSRRPQPVAPIYPPEVAARAIVHAAFHPRRREYWVGSSTAATLIANAIAPGLLDRYLARTNFQAQQSDNPRRRSDPVNLWEPADESADFGAHGRYRDHEVHRDPQPWASRHHGAVAAGMAAGVAAGLAGTAAKLRRRESSRAHPWSR